MELDCMLAADCKINRPWPRDSKEKENNFKVKQASKHDAFTCNLIMLILE